MSRPVRSRRACLLFTLCLACVVVAPAANAGKNLLVVRLQSIDAAAADIQQVATAAGMPFDRAQMLQGALGALGISDASWVDPTKPVVLTLPIDGMMLGQNGIVMGLPVQDAEAAIEALAEALGGHTVQGSMHTFQPEGGAPPLKVVAREGYLVAGANELLVDGFDLDGALADGGLPPGNLAAEVHLEPVAPMIQAGLMQGRQMILNSMQASQQAETGDDEAEGDEELEDVEPDGEGGVTVTAAPNIDPEAMSALFDLYFGVIGDMLNNVSRLQMSLEIGTGHVILHFRAIPTTGSTLAGLADAQGGEFPNPGRWFDPQGAFVVSAGRIELTSAAREAMKGYAHRYFDAITPILESAASADGPASMVQMMMPMLAKSSSTIDDCVECTSGTYASMVRLDLETGMQMVQLAGTLDKDPCGDLVSRSLALYEGIEAPEDGGPLPFSIQRDAFEYRGVSANVQELSLSSLMSELGQDEPAAAMFGALFGGDTIRSVSGQSDGWVITASGKDSDQQFRDVLDRQKKFKQSSRVDPALFAPFRATSGIAMAMDLGQIFRLVGSVAEGEEDLEAFANLPAGAGRLTLALRFEGGAANLGFALPMEMIEFIGEQARKEAAEAQAAAEEGAEETHDEAGEADEPPDDPE